MLHKGGSLYTAGRSDDLLKLKTHEDAEAAGDSGHLPGKGRLTGHARRPAGGNAEGASLPARHRGSPTNNAANPPPLGATVTYKHYGRTRNGVPRFASFLRVRDEI